jgi:hypothetical protein
MSLTRTLAVSTVLASLLLAGCGSDDGDGEGKADDSPASSSSEPDPGTTEATESEDVVEEPSGPLGICELITAEEMSDVLGGAVAAEEIPGGGCNFSQDADPRAASAALNETTVDDFAGGFEGTRTGVSAIVEGDVEDLEGVGDDAFVVAGSGAGGMGGGVIGAGAVLIGETVVQVTLLQAADLSAEDVKALTIAVLELIGSKA